MLSGWSRVVLISTLPAFLAACTENASPNPAPDAAVAASPEPAAPQAPTSPAPAAQARPAPKSVVDLQLVAGAQATEDLARWASDRTLEPRLRYAALRRLEELSPERATELAIALLPSEPAGFVRTNLIALLARSRRPEAQAALTRLASDEQRLATTLAARAASQGGTK